LPQYLLVFARPKPGFRKIQGFTLSEALNASKPDLPLPSLGKLARNPVCLCPAWASSPETWFAFAQLGQARQKFSLPLPSLGKLARNLVCLCPAWASSPETWFALAQLGQALKNLPK
jgi:hypothetical protein